MLLHPCTVPMLPQARQAACVCRSVASMAKWRQRANYPRKRIICRAAGQGRALAPLQLHWVRSSRGEPLWLRPAGAAGVCNFTWSAAAGARRCGSDLLVLLEPPQLNLVRSSRGEPLWLRPAGAASAEVAAQACVAKPGAPCSSLVRHSTVQGSKLTYTSTGGCLDQMCWGLLSVATHQTMICEPA